MTSPDNRERKRRFFFSSLRLRLIVFAIVILLPPLGQIGYTIREQQSRAMADTQRDTLRLARLIQEKQEEQFFETRMLLTLLANTPSIREEAPAGCSEFLARVLRLAPPDLDLLNLGLSGADGRVYCSALPLPGAVSVADQVYFRGALQSRKFSVGEYHIGRITKKPSVNFGHPIIGDDGAVRGVVFAALGLPRLNQFLSEGLLPRESIVTLLDRNGTVVARAPDPENWVGKYFSEGLTFRTILTQGQGVIPHQDGGARHLLAFTTLRFQPEAGNFYLTVAIPERAVFARARWLLKRDLILLGAVLLVASLGVWLLGGRFLVKPVNALLGATRRVAAGDLGARTGLPYDRGELGELAKAFDEMAGRIQQAYAQLLRSEKLSSIGTLVAGVSHEIMNPLQILSLQIHNARLGRDATDPEALRKTFDEMDEQIGRMARIHRNLLDFARQREPELKPLDVPKILDNVADLVEYQYRGENIEVVREYARNLPEIRGDEDLLRQVFLNLVANARDAMPEGGRITIRAGASEREGRRRVRVAVEDTGTGIPEKILPRIFDPFFTTKPEGKGTGMGLSIAYGVVQGHGGELDVRSAEGVGSTFVVDLPANLEKGIGESGEGSDHRRRAEAL